MQNVHVVQKDDDSVRKMINQKVVSLQKKYNKKRKINERFLKKKTPAQKVMTIIGNSLCVLLVFFAGIVCFSGINSRLQNICPTFFGYANLTIQSGSMTASGFNIGDMVIVKSVDTKTLHTGDKIAFYAYQNDYKKFNVNTCVLVDDTEIAKNKYTTSFGSVFGIQSSAIKEAAKANSSLVFHHIRAVYEDENGVRWFKTYGSSNSTDDTWFISENMVVGLYNNSGLAVFVSRIISAINSKLGFLFLLVPVFLLATVLVLQSMKDIEKAKLELDCVEEKRKITDPICVKNEIGFGMDVKTKYKILAQAKPKDYNEYLSLLWRGLPPENIRKYCIKKNILLNYNAQMVQLNRECEKMVKNGVDAEKIAEYYVLKKVVLQKEQTQRNREMAEKKSAKL